MEWVKLLTTPAVVIALIGASKSLIQWIALRAAKGDESAIQEVYEALSVLLTQSQASRALVLSLTNGDGAPTVSGQRYSSIIYEHHFPGCKSVRDDWQNQRTDATYDQMLISVQQNGTTEIRTETMDEGHLKSIYSSAGISWGVVAPLGFVRTRVWGVLKPKCWMYLSINFDAGIEHQEMTSRIQDSVRVAESKLSRILKAVPA